MSIDSTTVIDPFDISALDEETELRALARAIQFSDKFALLFARCNQPQQRKRVIERLQSQLPQLDVQEIHFTEPVTHLLDQLRERIRDPQPDVIFVSGLEYSLPVAADAHNTQFVVNLNAARNSFPNVIQKPLVLWVPEYALTAIARGAPDFFSIRSGVYFFAATPAETSDEANSLTSENVWAAWNLSLAEKQERIVAIESLLADYKALPFNQRDYQIEMRLHGRLGDFFYNQGAYSFAQQHFETSSRLAVELSDLHWQGIALTCLGFIHAHEGRLEEAGKAFQQSLEIIQKLGHRKDEAQILSNLGLIYSSQGQQEKAEAAYEQSLEITQESGDRNREAHALLGLGSLYLDQDKLEEAEKTIQRSVRLAHEVGNKAGESESLMYLGNIFSRQGRLKETNETFQQSLMISREIGYYAAEGRTLYYLAQLRNAEGKILEALEFAKQSVAVLEKMEDARSLEQARKLIRALEQQLQEQSNLVTKE